MWAFGCVMGAMLLGEPIFQGRTSIDQLVDIISILGTPSSEEISAMNSEQPFDMKYRTVVPVPLEEIFSHRAPRSAIQMLEMLLVYDPSKRPTAKSSLGLDFIREVRKRT